MTLVSDIFKFLDDFAPFENMKDFDNCGLLIGSLNCEVTKALIALDLTQDVLNKARELNVQLILTHHPVLFKQVKSILKNSILFSLVQSEINVISAHTNLDVALKGVSFCLAETLGLKKIEILKNTDDFGRIGFLNKPLSYVDFLKLVSEKLDTVVKAVKINKPIEKVAVVSGSGSFAFKEAINYGADAFVTGECKHHDFVEAFNLNFGLVEAGHYETENLICSSLKQHLEKAFQTVNFYIAESKPAYSFFGDSKWL